MQRRAEATTRESRAKLILELNLAPHFSKRREFEFWKFEMSQVLDPEGGKRSVDFEHSFKTVLALS